MREGHLEIEEKKKDNLENIRGYILKGKIIFLNFTGDVLSKREYLETKVICIKNFPSLTP